MRALAASLLLSLPLCACGSDAPPETAGRADAGAAGARSPGSPDARPADAPPRAVVTATATVRYTGTKSGPLGVGAFASNPPMGPPLAFTRVMNPSYPATVKLEGIAAGGSVFVIATIDVDPASPTVPGPEDPTGASQRLALPAQGGEVSADVTVVDR